MNAPPGGRPPPAPPSPRPPDRAVVEVTPGWMVWVMTVSPSVEPARDLGVGVVRQTRYLPSSAPAGRWTRTST